MAVILHRAVLVLVTAVVFLAVAEGQGGYDRRRFREMEDDATDREVNPMDIKVSSDQSFRTRPRPFIGGRMASALSSLGHHGPSPFDVIAQASAASQEDGDDDTAAADAGEAGVQSGPTGDALGGLSAYNAILQGQGGLYPVRQGSLAIGMRDRRRQRQQQRERALARLRGQGRRDRGRDQARPQQPVPSGEQPSPSPQNGVQDNGLPSQPQEGGEQEPDTTQAARQSEGEAQTAGPEEGEGEGQGRAGGEGGLLGVEGPLGPAFVTARTAYDYLSSQTRHGRPRTSERRSETDSAGFDIGEDLCELFGKHLVRTSIGGRCE